MGSLNDGTLPPGHPGREYRNTRPQCAHSSQAVLGHDYTVAERRDQIVCRHRIPRLRGLGVAVRAIESTVPVARRTNGTRFRGALAIDARHGIRKRIEPGQRNLALAYLA